jgi:hypothetical protein
MRIPTVLLELAYAAIMAQAAYRRAYQTNTPAPAMTRRDLVIF